MVTKTQLKRDNLLWDWLEKALTDYDRVYGTEEDFNFFKRRLFNYVTRYYKASN